MNPIFVFLVLIGAVILWFLLSGIFRIIGGITNKIVDDAKQAMFEEESEDKEIE